MTKRLLVAVVILAAITSVLSAQSKSPIQGVWRITETVGGVGAANDTEVNAKPQPGYYTFTTNHYSVIRVTGSSPRMPPKDATKPTVSELTDASRMQVQFGTYETKGESITLKLEIARNPATMNSALPISGTYKLDGKMLTLTLKNTTSGAISVVKMTRVE